MSEHQQQEIQGWPDPWNRGYWAGYESMGSHEIRNPYEYNSTDALLWNEGFNVGTDTAADEKYQQEQIERELQRHI